MTRRYWRLTPPRPRRIGGCFCAVSDCSEASLMEEGTRTGLAIGFDAWRSGTGSGCSSAGPDLIGVSIRIDGELVSQFPCPTLNGNCTDPSSLQTGPRGGVETEGLCWAPLKVDLSTDGKLNVYWKNAHILTDFDASAYSEPGPAGLRGPHGWLQPIPGGGQHQDHDDSGVSGAGRNRDRFAGWLLCHHC